MTFRKTLLPLNLATILLLAGCSGSTTGGDDALFSLPSIGSASPPPPVSETYVIQRAPVLQGYNPAELMAIEAARQEAEIQRAALAALEAQIAFEQQAAFDAQTFLQPQQPAPILAPAPQIIQSAPASNPALIAEAEARAAAAEAQAAQLATQLAEARIATAEAEAEARRAEARARLSVRQRVEELAAQRRTNAEQPMPDRANPVLPERPVLGRFATRPATPPPSTTPPARTVAALPPPLVPAPAARVAPTPPPPPRPIVEQSPIPGLKPYILARSAFPAAKPVREAPTRSFGIGRAAELSAPATPATNPAIAREPVANLSASFFPTPGKPSTLGTDRDTALDLVSIDAAPYGIGSGVALDDDATSAEWTDAVRLIENGEVEALAIREDADLVLTLCSGRSILTTPPDLSAAATLTAPQIICGQNKPLALR